MFERTFTVVPTIQRGKIVKNNFVQRFGILIKLNRCFNRKSTIYHSKKKFISKNRCMLTQSNLNIKVLQSKDFMQEFSAESKASIRKSNQKLHQYVEQVFQRDIDRLSLNDSKLDRSHHSESKDLDLINEQPSEYEHSNIAHIQLFGQLGLKDSQSSNNSLEQFEEISEQEKDEKFLLEDQRSFQARGNFQEFEEEKDVQDGSVALQEKVEQLSINQSNDCENQQNNQLSSKDLHQQQQTSFTSSKQISTQIPSKHIYQRKPLYVPQQQLTTLTEKPEQNDSEAQSHLHKRLKTGSNFGKNKQVQPSAFQSTMSHKTQMISQNTSVLNRTTLLGQANKKQTLGVSNSIKPQFTKKQTACEVCSVDFKIHDMQMTMKCGHKTHAKCAKLLFEAKEAYKDQKKLQDGQTLEGVIKQNNKENTKGTDRDNQRALNVSYSNNSNFVGKAFNQKPPIKFNPNSLFQEIKQKQNYKIAKRLKDRAQRKAHGVTTIDAKKARQIKLLDRKKKKVQEKKAKKEAKMDTTD
eukprot:403361084